MKKYKVNVNGTVFEVEVEDITGTAAAAAPAAAPAPVAAPVAAPLVTLTAPTVPSQGAMISFSIFMASRTISTSPFFTA